MNWIYIKYFVRIWAKTLKPLGKQSQTHSSSYTQGRNIILIFSYKATR
jgi:hypothetical protein